MDAREFLALVLPEDGYFIAAKPVPLPDGRQSWRNVPVRNIDALLAQAAEWVWEQSDAFFAVATYKKDRVWNPAKRNWKTNTMGAWERRTQANAKALRSFFLDLDVKPGKDDAFQSQADAVRALRGLCKTVGLPKPYVVNSGYGIHVYWPLAETADPADWKPAAEKLKAICVHEKVHADHSLTADSARVLRVPGAYNFKRDSAQLVRLLTTGAITSLDAFTATLDAYVEANDVQVVIPKAGRKMALPAVNLPAGVEDNLGVSNDPINGGMVAFACPAFAAQMATHGRTATEPQWRAALGIARFCEPQRQAMLAVSDGHAGFNEAAMHQKVSNWTGGPSTCASFWKEDNATCEACPSWRKITSPAQHGRMIREAAAPMLLTQADDTVVEVKLPDPPTPYSRRDLPNGTRHIVIRTEDGDGKPQFETIFPYDLYPVRILRQSVDSTISEKSVWRTTLPKLGDVDVSMPQSLMSDARKLHAFWLEQGAHINPENAKATQFYMTAYLRELAAYVEREKVYDRLGWHDDYRTFVTPSKAYHRDGSNTKHNASAAIRAITKDAIVPIGTPEQWVDAVKFYDGAHNENNRFFLRCSLAATIFHMTGFKGVLIAASGETGRGKSTVLEACASMWGDPEPMLISGGEDGTTTNALYSILGTYHSLPLFWDDTTERDAADMRRFLLNISQGKGKERMKGNEHDGRVVRWETLVLSSANTDDVSRIMATGKDSDPHLMRLVSVPFEAVDRSTESKLRADIFKRRIRDHYGHAGPAFLRYVVTNYEKVKVDVEQAMARIDRQMHAESQERYWTATIAVAFVAGQIAYRMGLLPFDPEADLAWMTTHVSRMRQQHVRAASTPSDTITEFLERHLTNTLTLSSKSASNLDNIVHEPRGALYIRKEIDARRLYVSRNALMVYCNEQNANFRKLEDELARRGVVLKRNTHKVLGADTPFATGQTRCWLLDLDALETGV
jgi:hypothetical protein